MRIVRIFLLGFFLAGTLSSQNIAGFTPDHSRIQNKLEKDFLKLPKAQNNRKYLHFLTEEPHFAGTPASKRIAEYLRDQYRSWGFDAHLEEYRVYLPQPQNIQIELVEPDSIRLNLRENTWIRDKDSYDSRAITPFNAYSPSGDVTAQVIYANRGLPDDYNRLDELGVDVKDKIVIVRYGGSFRGVKAQVAESHGAAGLIIYSDPADDGYMKGDVYPDGPMRPAEAIQRGSLLYIFKYPGDPLTPGVAAKGKVKRLPAARAGNVPHLPTTPISYGEARKILAALAGPEVPRGWQGGLPFRYHVGPGPAKVHLNLDIEYKIRPIYDVIAKIEGSEEPDKWVIVGNHHDAWVYGAVDPNSGTSSLMEAARSIGELLKTGWRPKRTIIFAHWDGEEPGLIGSTEWVEEHYAELQKHAAVYFNVDVGVAGPNFSASAVPSLDGFISDIAKKVTDPTSGNSVFERWWQRQHAKQAAKWNDGVPDSASVRVGRLGSGSDYTAFLDHVGIPALSMGFRGRYGVYHSILDNFYWMSHWGDPTFEYHAAMSKITGLAVLRFAQADVLPLDYARYAATLFRHARQLESAWKEKYDSVALDLTLLENRIEQWQELSGKLNKKIKAVLAEGKSATGLNELLMQSERDFTTEPGLPGREWFRHRIYAPGFYTGYASKPLPGIAEPVEQNKINIARKELRTLLRRMDAVIQTTETALEQE